MTEELRTIKPGDWVIVRATAAGVHFGQYVDHTSMAVTLNHARRLWFFRALRGAFLSGVAAHGLDNESKIGSAVECQQVLDACEVILCTDKAAKNIRQFVAYRE